MRIRALNTLLFGLAIFITQELSCQIIDSTSFSINTRMSFYSYEKTGEFLILVPANLTSSNLSVDIMIDGEEFISFKKIPGSTIFRIPFNINMLPSFYKIIAKISVSWKPGFIYQAKTDLNILSL